MQDIVADFVWWLAANFPMFRTPPWSGILIAAASIMVSSISNLGMKRFTDVRRLKRHQQEIKQYQKMQQEAQKTGNEKLQRKVRRRKAYIDRIQRDMFSARCKPSLIFLLPFMFIFWTLSGFFSGDYLIVAILPFDAFFLTGIAGMPVPGGFGMTYTGFYMLVGFGLSSILQRIMGTQIMT
ncbi:MAG: EMC3/TMCO1 family protein [Candidatus Thorarchaeota archaeon]